MPEYSEGEAYEAIATAENVLRDFICRERGLNSDADWLARSGLPPATLTRWQDKRSGATNRTDGVVPSHRLVDYSELSDLRRLFTPWSIFEPCFGTQNHFLPLLIRLGELRHKTMHGHALLPFERALAVGISGQIRNQVTIYRSQGSGGSNEADQYFPRIEYVRDSYGNVGPYKGNLILHPGDEVSFEGQAWDPEGVPVQWSVKAHPHPNVPALHEELALNMHYVWQVTERDIGAPHQVLIFIRAQRPYHRTGSNDGLVTFQYKVFPNG